MTDVTLVRDAASAAGETPAESPPDVCGPFRAGRLDLLRPRIHAEIPHETISQGVWPCDNIATIGG